MAKTAYVWDGTQFISISSPIAAVPNAVAVYSATAPTSITTGTVWNDTTNNQLKVWSGSAWVSYAPINNPTFTGSVTTPSASATSASITTANITTASVATLNVSGLVTIAESTESLATGTISANVFTADFATSALFYITTAPSANFTINVTNLPTTDNRVTVLSFFVIQGATGYIPSALQIGGASQTIKWSGGSAPTPTSSSGKVDVFTFTFIRRSSAWEVLGTSDTNY